MNTLSQLIIGIGAKRLSEVEVEPRKSNQHELNGIAKFKELFGLERQKFIGKFLYLSDVLIEDEIDINVIKDDGNVTWYDAREDHPTRTEFRLYYSSNAAIEKAKSGDLVVICLTKDNELLIFIAEANSTSESQLKLLCNLEEEVGGALIVKDYIAEPREIGFVEKRILETLGLEIEDFVEDYLEEMLQMFGGNFPKTKEFSEYSRSKLKDVDPISAPDECLVSWYEMEYKMFRTLEKHLVAQKLKIGFGLDGKDVEDFIRYSLSVHQRRKSRAGDAFENHLTEIFKIHKLKFTGQAKIGKAKPDFIFPGKEYYADSNFPVESLTMLGAKTSAKERWKQLLPETKITPKHFITLEGAISQNQTDDMQEKGIQLVIPVQIIATYKESQRRQIISFSDFIDYVKEKQVKAGL